MAYTDPTSPANQQSKLEILLDKAHGLLQEKRIEPARLLMEQALALGGAPSLAELCQKLEDTVLPLEAKSALNQADRQRSEGDLEAALASLRKAVELAPASLRAGNALGWFLAQQEQLGQAQVVFMELARRYPEVADTHANLAGILIRRGLEERAEESLRTVLKLDPNHIDAMLALMNRLAGTGDEPAAIELARRFLSIAPDHVAATTIRSFLAARGASAPPVTKSVTTDPLDPWFAGNRQVALDAFFARLPSDDAHRSLAISLQRSCDLLRAVLQDPRAREAWRRLFVLAKVAQDGGCLAVSRIVCKQIREWEPEYWFARELPRQEDGYYSQLDQDKVIEAFFRRHGCKHHRFVEVGAFDGVHYSNVRRLHEKYGWTGASIEPVRKNHQRLLDSYSGSGVHCVRAAASDRSSRMSIHVSTYPHLPEWGTDVASLEAKETQRWDRYGAIWTEEEVEVLTLDQILSDLDIEGFDVLSVDAEGHDLAVLKGLDFRKHSPGLVVVEYSGDREAILSYMESQGYSLLLDNRQDLFLQKLDPVRDVTLPEIKDLVHPHLLDLRRFDGVKLRTATTGPIHLLSPHRFDIAAKLLYGRHFLSKSETSFPLDTYREHIKAFNGFQEEEKNGFEAFLESFQKLLADVKANGLQASKTIVPTATGGIIIDGAHRIAAGILFDRQVPALLADTKAATYDYEWFLKRGLPRDCADAIATEYVRWSPTCRMALVFPAAQGRDEELVRLLTAKSKIVYRHDFEVRGDGPAFLALQMYAHEQWIGDASNLWGGVRGKAANCFPRGAGVVRAFLIEPDEGASMRDLKDEIRAIYGVQNHSVHINDSHEETRLLAGICFNENSRHFLSNAKLRHFETFQSLFHKFTAEQRRQGADPDNFCIDGSASLAVYGLRDCRDIDFLHTGVDEFSFGDPALIGSHNPNMADHVTSRDDILFNPRNHFFFLGQRFASLGTVRAMKLHRGEGKDKSDVAMIDALAEAPPTPHVQTNSVTAKFEWRKRPARIVGLVTTRNESAIIAQCLKSLARFTDSIVVLDDASTDDTASICESLAVECRVEHVIRKRRWYRDEPGDRNRLLNAGRSLGGTHFVVLDADECFTANLLEGDALRKQILSMNHGDSLELQWLQLWRSTERFRNDDSVWTDNYKPFVFCDNWSGFYSSEFIHTPRIPGGLKGAVRRIPGPQMGVMHFQFVDWDKLLLKQHWYQAMERIRFPAKPVTEINKRYAAAKDENGIRLDPVPADWFAGYDGFDKACYLKPDTWRKDQVLAWFSQYGRDHFKDLDIWTTRWDATESDTTGDSGMASNPRSHVAIPAASLRVPQSGTTERHISIVPTEIVDGSTSGPVWTGKLSIRDFGTGDASLRAILDHILANKVGAKGSVSGKLPLDECIAFTLEVELRRPDTATPITTRSSNLTEFDKSFAQAEGPGREADIMGYRDRLEAGEVPAPPSFVSGAILNACGANVDPDHLWMIDGARRIVAHALAGKARLRAEVLTTESHFATLVPQQQKSELKNAVGAIKWFASYQSIPLVGLQGDRTTNRFGLIDLSLLRGARVMDWGCNIGQASVRAALAGAKEVVGVEGMPDTFAAATKVAELSRLPNLRFAHVDFNAADFDAQVDRAVSGQVDWSFFFSVYRTKELVQRDRLFQKIIDKTSKGIFFEGHADPVIDTIDYYRWLFESYSLDWKHLGNSEGSLRPLFLLTWDKARQRRQNPSWSAAATPAATSATTDSVTATSAPAASVRKASDTGPLVTAILSTYASSKLLPARLENLLAQTLGDRLEIVVIDSCSPENDAEIANSYAARDPRIKVVRTAQRETIYKAWNRGVDMARGRYLTNANADDLLRADALERMARELDAAPATDLVYGDFWITHLPNQSFEKARKIGYSLKPEFAPSIMLSGCHMGPQPMWRKSLHDRFGLFDAALHAAGDYEFWCRCAAGGAKFRHIPEFLGLYLHNLTGLCNGDVPRVTREADEIRRKYSSLLPPVAEGFHAEGFYRKEALPPGSGYLNLGIVDRGDTRATLQAIESVWRKSRNPYTMTLIGTGSAPEAANDFRRLQKQGILTNYVEIPGCTSETRTIDTAASMEPDSTGFVLIDPIHLPADMDWLEAAATAIENSKSAVGSGPISPKPPAFALLDGNLVRISTVDTTATEHATVRKPTGIHQEALVNIGIVTYNRLDFTRKTIDSLLARTNFPHLLTVVDNASTDGTREYLQDLERRGIIDHLILLDENVGVAKASNLAWSMAPAATHFLKLDNDIVFQKDGWLDEMVRVVDALPEIGVVAYNFEPTSYPLQEIRGVRLRPKNGTLGGACILIPQRTKDLLGVWCEDYGLYGEEDLDYGMRVVTAGLANAYMEDEDMGFHLPAGKAASIDPNSLVATDGKEETIHADYRHMKDESRANNHRRGVVQANFAGYRNGTKSLKAESTFAKEYKTRNSARAGRPLTVLVCSHDRPDSCCGYLRAMQHFVTAPEINLRWNADFRDGLCIDIDLGPFLTSSGLSKGFAQDLQDADIVMVQRGFVLNRDAMLAIMRSGKPWVLDIDDLLWEGLPPGNHHADHFRAMAPMLIEVLRSAHSVFTSTSELAKHALVHQPDVHVVPNLLAPEIWDSCSPISATERIVIGYAGTATHSVDLALVEDVLERIAAVHGDRVAFHFLGCSTERLMALPNARFTPFSSGYLDYGHFLAQTGIQIALAPLEDHPFNRAKSAIKWMEYASCGIAGVYSDLEPYREVVRDGENGFLASRDPDRWFECIDRLVRDQQLRCSIANTARRDVVENHILKSGRSPLIQALKEVAEKHGIAPASIPDISIVIPVHGRLDLTRQCLESLEKTIDPSSTEIIVVDDASKDGTAAWLEQQHKLGKLRSIAQMENRGFAKSCNAGAAAARGQFLVFLNNDTIAQPGWLEAMSRTLRRHPECGMVGSRLLYPDGRIQHAGISFDDNGVPDHPRRFSAPDAPEVNIPGEVPAVTGACIMLPTGLFRELGGFDESYPMYVEDVDLCLKVWEIGKTVRYAPDSALIHLEGSSTTDLEKRARNSQAGLDRMWSKWRNRWPEPVRRHAWAPAWQQADLSVAWISPALDGQERAIEEIVSRRLENVAGMFRRDTTESVDARVNVIVGTESVKPPSAPGVDVALVLRDPARFPKTSIETLSRMERIWCLDPAWVATLVSMGIDRSRLHALPLDANFNANAASFVREIAKLGLARRERQHSPLARPNAASAATTSIRWCGDLFNFSGYARLGREAIGGLMDDGIHVTADPSHNDLEWFKGLDTPASRRRWTELLSREPEPGVLVCCDLPRDASGRNEIFDQMSEANPGCGKRVGWTMFETDRLPAGWAESLNRLDEIWVPSEFNRRTFSDNGVEPSRIHIVPGSIDPSPYLLARPMELPATRAKSTTTFLSVFQWVRRKGWDILLTAWSKAFRPDENVRLVLRCHPYGNAGRSMRRIFQESLTELGLRESDMAPIVLLDEFIAEPDMPSLYAACDVFVLPTRGEGWGLPFMEAMASAKPCIATAWGASLDFLTDDNSWLIPPGSPVEPGPAACSENPYLDPTHRWADPQPEQVARLMRHAATDKNECAAKAKQARADIIEKWNPRVTSAAIAKRLRALDTPRSTTRPDGTALEHIGQGRLSEALAKVASGLKETHGSSRRATGDIGSTEFQLARNNRTPQQDSSGRKLSIRWEGSQFIHHSLAHVNRELALGLRRIGHELSLIPFEPDQFDPSSDPRLAPLAELVDAPLRNACDVHVRHQWPPNLEAPKEGKWVVVQPWEFGSPPKDWIPTFSTQVDELWAYTNHVRQMYLEAGVPPEIVKVVPLGVDCDAFRPGLPAMRLSTRKSFKFLFVGGTIARKGFDVLLNAWKEAFGPDDDVCLVVKDIGGKSFYKGQTGADWIRGLQASGKCAEIEYIDADLQPSQLPGLYAACDVLVHPYRGEGFGLPIAEAMACGLPCVITRGGAADDFCTEAESWGVSAERVPVPGGKVGPFETVAEPWWLEPSAPDLVDKLRQAFSDTVARSRKGAAARGRIALHFTWDKAAEIVQARLGELADKPPRRKVPAAIGGKSFAKLASMSGVKTESVNPASDPESEASPQLEALNRLLFKAEAAAARGDIAEADRFTEEAVDSHSDQHLAWLARAMVLRGLGKHRKATEAIDRCLKLKPVPEALLEAFQIHLLAGESGPAKRVEKALKDKHAAWLKSAREDFRARGQSWPLDAAKTTKSVAKSVAPPRKGRH